jgi:GDP-mannose 6-dehydrogenase
VKIASMVGANRNFILRRIPHISRLMVDDPDTMLAHGETIVTGNRDPDFQSVPQRLLEDQVLVPERRSNNGRYDGICW